MSEPKPLSDDLPVAYRLTVLAAEGLFLASLLALGFHRLGLAAFVAGMIVAPAVLARWRRESVRGAVWASLTYSMSRWLIACTALLICVAAVVPSPMYVTVSFLVCLLIVLRPWLPRAPWRSLADLDEPWVSDLRLFAQSHGVQTCRLLAMDQAASAGGPALYLNGPPPVFAFDRGLMNDLTPPQRLAVFAHELTHHRLRHAVLSRLARSVASLAAVAIFCLWSWLTWRFRPIVPVATGNWLGVALLPAWLTCLLLHPLYLAYMRQQERQANRLALAMTGDREAFVSAMQKVAAHLGQPPRRPTWWVYWFFATHPTLEQTLKT